MIRATMIVEIAGAPPEHVKKSLGEYILNLQKMSEVEVHSIKISDPNPIEDQPNMFSCFAEADFSVHDVSRLLEVVFDFMPSSIEITSPNNVSIDSTTLTEVFNGISGRLHRYDDVAKASYAKIRQLTQYIQAQKNAHTNKSHAHKQAVAPSKTTKKATKKAQTKKSVKKTSKKKTAKKASKKKKK